jgi:hypothetical protein
MRVTINAVSLFPVSVDDIANRHISVTQMNNWNHQNSARDARPAIVAYFFIRQILTASENDTIFPVLKVVDNIIFL